MIEITKLNGQKVTINSELIESMEETPDTTITLTNGDKFIARESIEELTSKALSYKREFYGFHMIYDSERFG
ncbi:MAG: flagellar FlbD family protein [Clostridiales bacterium]|jgi:flagellar protein FlbD|nr:flagellar FlbD family protein [Clostridiales bacterium]